MRPITRRLLSLYLAFSVVFSPVVPAFAQPTPTSSTEQQRLPELGSAATVTSEPSSKRSVSEHSPEWLLQAGTDKDLAPSVVRDRTQGIDQAMAQGAGLLSGAASEAVETWFSGQKITSQLELKIGRAGVKGGSLDVLVPFYNAGANLVFVQAGMRRANTYTEDYRNTVNLGLGYRRDVAQWLLGVNSFYDRDLTGKNDRLGVGVEAWTDFLKLSANSYLPLSSWKNSPDQVEYLERPAKGWDVRAEGYLPAYPQLGGRLAYEQYYGKQVSLFSADDRQQDPHALTVGVIYTPVPLVGLSVDHRMGQGGLADTSAQLSFNYRLGEPLAKQLSSDNLMASRMLKNMRYDLVARNNEIVLDHQKNGIQMHLPQVISDTENKTVQFPLTGATTLQSVTWTGTAAGFTVPYDGSGQATLTLPAYVVGGNNTYTLQAVGIDRNGRTVVSNWTSVVVQSVGFTLTANPESIEASGLSTSTLKAKIVDAQGRAVGAGVVVSWTTTAGTLPGKTSTTDAQGETSVQLTSPSTMGFATVEATAGAIKRSARVTFTAGAASALSVSASPTSIVADGTSTSSLKAIVKDARGNLVGAGVAVSWTTTAGTLAAASSATNASGEATMLLTSATALGSANVAASSGAANGSTTVAFTAGDAKVLTLSATPNSIVADGASTTTLQAILKDAKGNLVGAGVTVNWTTNAGTLDRPSSTTNASGAATVLLTSATATGTATVQAASGAANGSAAVSFTAGVANALTVSATPTSIVANGTSTSSLKAIVKDSHGNPVGAGVTVNWTTSAGTVAAASSATNASGEATMALTSSTATGTASVQASSGAANGSTTVSFTAGAASALTVNATPTSLVADGTSTSTLKAIVKDAHGNLVGAGVTVNWATNAGTFAAASSATNASGEASMVLTSSTTAGNATVQATSGAATGSTSVAFTAGAASTLTLSAAPTSIVADGSSTSTLKAIVKDVHGNPVGAGVTVNWTTTSGALDTPSSVTNASGEATMPLTSSTTTGSANVQATSGAATGSTTVTFTVGAASALALTATPNSLVADGTSTSTLNAAVKDAHGNAVGAGVTVNWTTTSGALDNPSSTTDASGSATMVLTSSTVSGAATVQATSGAANASTSVAFTVGAVSALTLLATPNSIVADGSSASTLSATVKDAHGNAVGAGVKVDWTTTSGALDNASSTTNASGIATVVLTSSTVSGAATVQASSGAANASTSVAFTAGAASALTLSATPDSLVADGSSTSTLKATVKDVHGNAVGAGVTVNWTTTSGTLGTPSSVTNASGEATMLLTSSTAIGTANVQASSGAASASTSVAFTVGEASVLTLSASPDSLVADGTSTSTLNATVKDARGNAVGAGVTVNWTTTSGALDNPSSVTDASGVATARLTSSATVGTATLEASVNAVRGSTSVVFTVGPPTKINVTAASGKITADGISTSALNAQVLDSFNRPVGAGIKVDWTTVGDKSGSTGSLSAATSTTDANGNVTNMLTSSTWEGINTVEASVGSVRKSTTVEFDVSIKITYPSSVAMLEQGDKTTVTAVVTGADGRPAAGIAVYWRDVTNGVSVSPKVSTTDVNGITTVTVSNDRTAVNGQGSGVVVASVGSQQLQTYYFSDYLSWR